MNDLEVQELHEKKKIVDRFFDEEWSRGLPTGYKKIDDIAGGIKLGSTTIIAGATGMGKSLLSLNILINMAKSGRKVTYFDLENGSEVSKKRILKAWYGLKEDFFADKGNADNALEMLLDTEESMEYWNHEELYKWGLTEKGISLIVEMIKTSKSEVFLIDPLQALETKADNQLYQEQGVITRKFKEIAQEKGKAILICHHVRKSTSGGGVWVDDIDDVEGIKYRLPTLDDLRGSGKISDFATDVWSMVRTASSPTKEGRGKTLLRILKNRVGSTGDVKLFFDEDTLQFRQQPLVNYSDLSLLNGGIYGN